jgi:hypothetical protein
VDDLVITPPVHSPAEPAAGAFLLAAGLAGAGRDAGLLDLSLAFFWRELRREGRRGRDPAPDAALDYLLAAPSGYEPEKHRSALGHLHDRLKRFGARHPGWRLTLMDLEPPVRVHDPAAVAGWLDANPSPFAALWEESLVPVLEAERPRRVLVSLAYLSQLPAAIDLVRFLDRRGVRRAVGGSLPRSLAATGAGLEALGRAVGPLDLGDGSSLVGSDARPLLDSLAWPRMLSPLPYLSARPIVPLALSSGCFWRRCRFCPDRALPYRAVPTAALERFFESVPAAISAARPVVHLLDSAIPPGRLRRFLPLAKASGAAFYGFARPTRHLLKDSLVEAAAEAGCLMLQLGVESGSGPLLERFDKGVDPAEAERVTSAVAGAGVRTYLYLLFGLPGETEADREATLELLARNDGSVDFLNLSLFNLPRFCELTDRAEEHGIALGEFPSEGALLRLYRPFTCGGRSPRDEARAFLKARLLCHPLIRAAHLRTPRWLRAAHLALMRVPGRRSP